MSAKMTRVLGKHAIRVWMAMTRARRQAVAAVLQSIQDDGCADRREVIAHPRSTGLKVCQAGRYAVVFECDHERGRVKVLFIYNSGAPQAKEFVFS